MRTPYQARKIEELANLGWADQGNRLLSHRKGQDPRYMVTLANSIGMQVFVYPEQVEYDCGGASITSHLTHAIQGQTMA